MKMSSSRILFACLCMGILSLLGSCNQSSSSHDTESNYSAWQQAGDERLPGGPDAAPVTISVSKITLVSRNGMEVEVDPLLFEQQLTKFLPELVPLEDFKQSGNQMYTVIGWDKQDQPLVLQIYPEGMKMGQEFYGGSGYEQFTDWLREYLGQYYFDIVELDRMTLQANDLGIKSQIRDEQAQDIFSIIQESTLQKRDIRITEPLYPYYQLVIENSGGKDYISIDVISPTLVSLHDGQDRWYYQLSESLFSYLTEVIPIQDYSARHIKHLFTAVHVTVHHRDQVIKLKDYITDDLKLKSKIHLIARLLSRATPDHSAQNIELQTEYQPIQLLFSFANNEVQTLQLYKDFFIFDEQIYMLPNIREQIQVILDQLSHN